MEAKLYEEILDDYSITTIFVKEIVDLNSIDVYHRLYEAGKLTNGIAKEVDGKCIIINERKYNGDEYASQLYFFLSKEYLDSAIVLAKFVLQERKIPDMLSSYANPCSFLCRHAIELKLKHCLSYQRNSNSNAHNLKELWDLIDKSKMEQTVISELDGFIDEVSRIDEKGISWRYGTDKKCLPINDYLQIDCCILTQNTMYLFNQLQKICY